MKVLLAVFSSIDIISGILILLSFNFKLIGILLLIKGLLSLLSNLISGFFFDFLGFIDVLGGISIIFGLNLKLVGTLLLAKGLYSMLFIFV